MRLRWIFRLLNPLPFKGRVRVGMGESCVDSPIPHLASPLKGEERNGFLEVLT
jgi:hypothetical protein